MWISAIFLKWLGLTVCRSSTFLKVEDLNVGCGGLQMKIKCLRSLLGVGEQGWEGLGFRSLGFRSLGFKVEEIGGPMWV